MKDKTSRFPEQGETKEKNHGLLSREGLVERKERKREQGKEKHEEKERAESEKSNGG
jgi:hypothetical protein